VRGAHGWTEGLPKTVELIPIELPSRSTRWMESAPYAASLPQLAKNVLDGLGRAMLSAKPYVLFGHSFGAWLVYEMYQELSRRANEGWPQPLKIYVSGSRAPQLSGVENDPDRINPTLGNLEPSRFWDAFENRYGKNPDLQSDHAKEFVLPCLQADFSILETYTPSCLTPLSIPLCACCAIGDNRCDPPQLSAWMNCAQPGSFQERWFDHCVKPSSWATEHRYVNTCPEPLLCFLSMDLPLVGHNVSGYSGVEGPLPEQPKNRRCVVM